MSKEIYISSTPHETRLAIVEKDELSEIYYERENEYTLAGSIYNGRVTRVLPGMQSSFVDIGLERDAFLYITDFLEEAVDGEEFESTHSGGAAAPRNNDRKGPRRSRSQPSRGASARCVACGHDAPPQRARTSTLLHKAPRARAAKALTAVAAGAVVVAAVADAAATSRLLAKRSQGASPASQIEPIIHAVKEETAAPREESRERGNRNDRSRGRVDRGGRDRHDGRHDAIRERFAPRGLRNDAGETETVDLDASANAVEPFILPGESLSKYRPREAGSAPESHSAPANVSTPKPSTEFVPLVGWDGGAVLPGETPLAASRAELLQQRQRTAFAGAWPRARSRSSPRPR